MARGRRPADYQPTYWTPELLTERLVKTDHDVIATKTAGVWIITAVKHGNKYVLRISNGQLLLPNEGEL